MAAGTDHAIPGPVPGQGGGPSGWARPGDLRAVLGVPAFRRLWVALSLSSLGDWLGLLATTALAQALVAERGLAAQLYATGGVLVLRLVPAVLIGPFAGAAADRVDRRRLMLVADLARFGLFASIPLVGRLAWLLAASFLVEAVGLGWVAAKDAAVPNLAGRRLAAANQLSLLTTYGTAPIAAAVFSLLSVASNTLASGYRFFDANPVDLALYFNAATFLFSALTVWRLPEIGRSSARPVQPAAGGLLRSVLDGWRFAGQTPWIRGIVVGTLGAFAAGGVVVALGRVFVEVLHGGNAGYGVLFGTVFSGLALGMAIGPRLLPALSRRRLVGCMIIGAGSALAVTALLPDLLLVLVSTLAVGFCAGTAWVVGYTLLGQDVADEVRGRTFALLQSLVRVDLLLVLTAAPFVAGLIGEHEVRLSNGSVVRADGVTVTLFGAGVLAAAVGVLALRLLDDRPGVPLWRDLAAALRGDRVRARSGPGLLVALEGGEGAGKSTQVSLLAGWLSAQGYHVVVTREPGGTPTGDRLRALLLDPAAAGLSPRAEALLYAADRAEHVARVIRPALAAGAVVLTDRYVDSSLAYQGAGRVLAVGEVARISGWATGGLHPDLTVVLDIDPQVGLARAGVERDRIEAEPLGFHERVRHSFLALARAAPGRYLVVPADRPADEVHWQVRERVAALLPAVRPARPAVPVEGDLAGAP